MWHLFEWDDNIFTLSSNYTKQPETQVVIGQSKVKVLIDSGSSVNILNKGIFEQIKHRDQNNLIILKKTCAKIHAYGAEKPIELAGKFTTDITSQGKTTSASFYVVDGKHKCILGCQSSVELGLLTLNINNVTQHDDTRVK